MPLRAADRDERHPLRGGRRHRRADQPRAGGPVLRRSSWWGRARSSCRPSSSAMRRAPQARPARAALLRALARLPGALRALALRRRATPTPATPAARWVTRFEPAGRRPGAGEAALRARPARTSPTSRVVDTPERPVRRPLPHRGGPRLPVGLPLLRRRLRAAPLPRGGPRDAARRGEEGHREGAAHRPGRPRHQRLHRPRPAHLLHRRGGRDLQPVVAAGGRHHAGAGRAHGRRRASAPSPSRPRPAPTGCARW